MAIFMGTRGSNDDAEGCGDVTGSDKAVARRKRRGEYEREKKTEKERGDREKKKEKEG